MATADMRPVGFATAAPYGIDLTHPVTGSEALALKSALLKFFRREDGQGLAEYALVLALIAVIAIAALLFLGTQISTILSEVGARI